MKKNCIKPKHSYTCGIDDQRECKFFKPIKDGGYLCTFYDSSRNECTGIEAKEDYEARKKWKIHHNGKMI